MVECIDVVRVCCRSAGESTRALRGVLSADHGPYMAGPQRPRASLTLV